MKATTLLISGLIGCLFLASCEKSDSELADAPAKPIVYAVNYPLYYFAKEIGGDQFDIRFNAPEEGDPAFWQPTDEDVSAMQQADLLLMNGGTYAKWAEHVSLPRNTQVNTSQGFSDDLITVTGKVTHSHGDGVVHSHDGIAFTTWLNFQHAIKHVDSIVAALAVHMPKSKLIFEQKAVPIKEQLAKLDQEMIRVSKRVGNRPLVSSHPVYQYLAQRYQLNIRTVHWEPEVVPDKQALGELGTLLAEHPAKIMIWEGDPSVQSVGILKDKGVVSVVFEPMGNRPDRFGDDFFKVMQRNIENLNIVIH